MEHITSESENKVSHTIENTERLMSVISGATILYHELKKEEAGKLKMGIAAYLIYRGLTGHCKLSEATGLNSSVITGLSRFL